MFSGRIGDGFSQRGRTGFLEGVSFSTLFEGGLGDGYMSDRFLGALHGESMAILYRGGPSDGFDQSSAIQVDRMYQVGR